MNPSLSRRQLLQRTAAGTVLLTMPTFLASCATSRSRGSVLPEAALNDDPFGWFGVDEALVQQVMARLTARGADHADLYFQHSRSNSIRFQDGIVSSATTGIDQGVGLRVVIGDQVGYAFTEELTLDAMLQAAVSASAIARGAPVDPSSAYRHLARPDHYALSVPWHEVGVDRKLPLIRQAAAMAERCDPAVEKVTVSWSDAEDRVLVADVHGAVHTDVRPMTRLGVRLTATKDGETQSNGSNLAARQGIDWYTDEQLEKVVGEARDRTMILFDARRPPAGELPVVLAAGASGILLHEAIGHGMEADFNRKNVSIYADMIGKQIAPDFVTIIDDGTVDHERGALNVDDEGVTAQRTVLVERGVLASYLHDGISAKHYGLPSTGSGRRQSFRHAPMPRMRCTFMEDGPHTRDEIVAAVDTGIIAETFTNGQVQIGAGDFTFYIKNGWLIEGGRITAPIKDVNIIGNGPEALRAVTMAANDARLDTGGWTCGKDGQSVPVSQGLPTVLVSKLTVGGQNA
jgi:TldD protein